MVEYNRRGNNDGGCWSILFAHASTSLGAFYEFNPFLPRCPFGALFYSIVHNSLNIGPIEKLPVTSVGALAQLFIMVSNLMIRPVLTELREFKVDPSNSPN